MKSVRIKQQSAVEGKIAHLPASKSISNRALILNALSGDRSVVSNLSEARDTQLMKALLASPDKIADVKDAGTTMRFLTAFFSVTGKAKVLTGTARMKERPIGLLVDALRKIGANIQYLEKEGFPPIEIGGLERQLRSEIEIDGSVSSQYISALMMIAPSLPEGLAVRLTGKVGSRPYIAMTAELMRSFGATLAISEREIHISPQSYRPTHLTVESDWSAASYWYAVVALAETATIELPRISLPSLQGDHVIIQVMDRLGVKTEIDGGRALLSKKPKSDYLEWDFSQCPDLGQTVLPVCAAANIRGQFTGLESLRIKESDRIAALQHELAKIGATIEESPGGVWKLSPDLRLGQPLRFETYHDHRMAMGLAPLATLMDIEIQDPAVVNKSYPRFWDDMASVGFEIASIA